MFPHREAIDACRPGSDDLAQPEFAAARAELQGNSVLQGRAERAEQFDRGVAAAMHDVAVPAGLKERLLAQLAVAADPVVEKALPTPSQPGQRGKTWARQIVAAVALAASIAAVSFTVRWYVGGENWDAAPVAYIAVQQFEQFDPRVQSGWISGRTPLTGYPLSRHVIQERLPPQRKVSGVAGCDGMAYQLQSRQGAVATLLVLKPRYALTDFPTKPPREPQIDTAGRTAASWAEKDRLYVLIVAGNSNDYRGFLPRRVMVAMR